MIDGVTLLVSALLAAAIPVAEGSARVSIPVPASRQLLGVSSQTADALIAKLQDRQRALKEGTPPNFMLLSGASASSEAARMTPREAFLAIPFDKVWRIELDRTGTRSWQPYRLAYAPNGLGQLYWEIEVTLDFKGAIAKVELTYKPPAPF